MSKEPLSPELEAMLQRVADLELHFAWICVDAIPAPTPDQIRAVQTFYPHENLLTVRRRLTEGTAMIGPLDPDAVDDFAAVALLGTGLTWRAKTGAELAAASPSFD
jgi:hypothetical protein